MIKSKNEVIYIIRQIIGNEKSDGFYTPVEYNGKIIEVPNFLFKDAPAKYPEIRISPFLEDNEESHSIRVRKYNYDNKKTFYTAKFQIDIYATNAVEVNQIYDAVSNRIDLAYDIDSVIYGYDKRFKRIDNNLYLNSEFTSDNFQFSDMTIDNITLEPVLDKDLLTMNTYAITKDGLYIYTCMPITHLRMRSIINGLLLPDGKTAYARGIIKTNISDKITLSELEKNNVERISFELDIFYAMDQIRNPGPLATHAIIE